jgi:subtilase family serine protease
MTVRMRRVCAPAVIGLGLALLWVQAAAASNISPLPASDYSLHAACGAAAVGHARCLALELVPETAAARARTHPLGMTRSAPIRAGKAAEGAEGLRPQDLHSAYALPATAPSAQTIAVIDAYNDPEAEADLGVYDEEFGLPACTTADGCFTKLNQEGKTSPLPKTEGGWSLEISLDIEVAHAVCQNCHILLVEAKTSSYANLEAAEDAAAAAGAKEISNSWGGEPPSVDSAAFEHPGVVITAAAGDEGYLDWDAKNKDERGYADYPASSPHVIAVGGTHLELKSPADTWQSESVWNGDGATGGGCSARFEAQPWQRELSNWSAVGCGSERAVADVAADADPYTGVAVYDTTPYEGRDLKWLPVGGTSLATPLIASVFALAGGADGVQYPAKTLYENRIKRPSSLHDIETGSNGECTKPFNSEGLSGCSAIEEAASCSQQAICLAGPGYNGPTGVGTPDGTGAFEPTSTEAPSVTTEAASSLTQTSATLNATVNPNGASVSECKFEYGTTMVYGDSVACSSSPGSGTTPVAVSAKITTLAANTTYYYRISATNADGTSEGLDEELKTPEELTVSSVTPTSGPATGGTAITITGSGFQSGAVVKIGQGNGAGSGAIPATDVQVVSSTEITATTGGGAIAGTWNLFVIDPGGATSPAVTADQYTYK